MNQFVELSNTYYVYHSLLCSLISQFNIEAAEIVSLSLKVSKFNNFNWVQERNLLITQDYLYNFKSKSKVFSLIPIRTAKEHTH